MGALPGRAAITKSESSIEPSDPLPPEVDENDTSMAAVEFERERLREEKMEFVDDGSPDLCICLVLEDGGSRSGEGICRMVSKLCLMESLIDSLRDIVVDDETIDVSMALREE